MCNRNASSRAMTILCTLAPLFGANLASAEDPMQFRDLFNGSDLSGWTDVNTSPTTWSVRDGLLVCSGHPIGVMRSDRQYQNFILHIEWRHMEAGGNSGVFIWSEATIPAGKRLPKGLEVQMLDHTFRGIAAKKLLESGEKHAISEDPEFQM